jgi:AcrR family transcriptional regulator
MRVSISLAGQIGLLLTSPSNFSDKRTDVVYPDGVTETRTSYLRGSLEKRSVIMLAARALFMRVGYASSSIDDIASEASVSRQTIYSHFGDKASLFRAVVADANTSYNAELQEVIDAFPQQPQNLEEELVIFTIRLVRAFFSDASIAIRRFSEFEMASFPDLCDTVRGQGPARVHNAMIGYVARLHHMGLLSVDDPNRFVRQYMSLIYDPHWHRARLGYAPPDLEDVEATVRANTGVLLRAYASK